MTLHTRGLVRLIAYSLALALVLSGFLAESRIENVNLKAERRREARRAYQSFLLSLETLDAALLKTTAAQTPAMVASLASEAAGEAESAGASLLSLPGAALGKGETAAFLNRTADFTRAAARDAGRGKLPDAETKKTLMALREGTKGLLSSFSELSAYIYGEGCFEDPPEALTPEELAEKSEGSFAGTLLRANGDLPGIPEADYDGKYAASLSSRKPEALSLPEVAMEEARERAAGLFGLPREALTPAGESEGEIPGYEFTWEDGGETRIRLSKNGGRLLFFSAGEKAGNGEALSPGDAAKKGGELLEKAGYAGLEPGVTRKEGEILYIEYAPGQNGARLYPDRIILGLSLSGGELLYLDASEYLARHRERDLPASFGEEAAAPSLPEGFSPGEVRTALIASEGGREIPCFEVRTADRDGNGFLVYLNAETGEEEKILLISEEDGCFRTY